MAKRIFITGASGFIGKTVVERLLRDDHQLSLLYLPEEPTEKFSDLDNLRSGKFKIMGDGNHSVDLVNVIDVAESVSLVLENDISKGQTYNIANQTNPTWNEFLHVVAEELNILIITGIS